MIDSQRGLVGFAASRPREFGRKHGHWRASWYAFRSPAGATRCFQGLAEVRGFEWDEPGRIKFAVLF
jgi:hypothetical protein